MGVHLCSGHEQPVGLLGQPCDPTYPQGIPCAHPATVVNDAPIPRFDGSTAALDVASSIMHGNEVAVLIRHSIAGGMLPSVSARREGKQVLQSVVELVVIRVMDLSGRIGQPPGVVEHHPVLSDVSVSMRQRMVWRPAVAVAVLFDDHALA